MSISLSVLDQSPIRRGGTAAQAVRETIELARHCDALGFRRYWIAEHHNSGGLASASPEILIGQVAAATQNIRVGSGGVMLSHYSPLKVAEQFRMLEALFPGRIDLGLGRAPGSDTKTMRALATGPGQLDIDHYPNQVLDLYGYLTGTVPPTHAFHGIRAQPQGDTNPDMWLLGSSGASALYAAELGMAFCFAQFITPDGGEQVIRQYRKRFEPSPAYETPRAAIGISVTCAETDEEAEHLSWSRWNWRIAQGRGGQGIPSPEEAKAYDYTEPELDYIAHMRHRSVYGSPGTVRARIEEMAEQYDVDEFIIVTITYDFEARKNSYTLLAKEFGLTPPVAAK